MTKPDTGTAAPSHPAWRAYAAEILERARAIEARNDAERAILLEEHGDAADDLPPIRGEGPVAYTSRRQQMMILCLAATIDSEARLQGELERGAIIAITGLPVDLLKDVQRLLPALLPVGWRVARSEHERRRPGALAVTRARQDDREGWDKEYRIFLATHRLLNRVIGPFASPVQQVWRAFIDQNHPSPDMQEVLAGSRT